eukprot:s619_g8.t1
MTDGAVYEGLQQGFLKLRHLESGFGLASEEFRQKPRTAWDTFGKAHAMPPVNPTSSETSIDLIETASQESNMATDNPPECPF